MNQQPKLLTKTEIKNSIKIIDFACTDNGLEISYKTPGKYHFILASPERAAMLLKEIDQINDWCGSGDLVSVEVVFEYDTHDRVIQCTWEEFSDGFTLSQSMALDIATNEEDRKQTDRIKRHLDVDALIGDIFNMGGAA